MDESECVKHSRHPAGRRVTERILVGRILVGHFLVAHQVLVEAFNRMDAPHEAREDTDLAKFTPS